LKLTFLRELTLYKILIRFIFYSLFNFFWQYIINFEAKFLYFYWNIKKKNNIFFELNNNDTILIKDNQDFKNISKDISNNLKDKVENVKKKLLSEEFKKEHIERLGKNHVDVTLPYRISVWEHLDKSVQKQIIDFASSDKMISTAARHMKIFPILTRIQVYLNTPRENAEMRGAMYWHKDTFGFKNLDFFMNVSDVDDESGPFYFLNKKIQGSVFMHFKKMRPFDLKGERGKVDLEEFSKYFPDSLVEKVVGESGTAIFLDSFSTFHRGGFCKSKNRIVLRICYQSHDAKYESQVTNLKEFKYNTDLTFENTKNIFYRYFYFKEKSAIIKKFSSIMLRFFWKIRYYIK